MRTVQTLIASALLTTIVLTPTANAAPTFTKDVMPIFQENCQVCHRPGQVAPFSLMTYKDARPWAKSIKKYVSSRKMPPWFADPSIGKFKHDQSLSQEEIDTIVDWVDQGAKQGKRSDLPMARVFEEHGDWRLKDPDLVYEYPRPFLLGKEVDDEYRCFPIPLGVDHDVWLKGVEYKPGNTEVVHHFILFNDTRGIMKKEDAKTPEPGCECGMSGGLASGLKFIHAWAPGNNAGLAPEGIAWNIPKGSDLVLQVHYHNVTGADQLDQSKFALHIARDTEVIKKQPIISVVSAWKLNIPANEPYAEHTASWTAPKDVTFSSAAPHMHYRGKDMKVFYQRPGEEEVPFLWVPNYDFNWQLSYILEEPLKLPKGSKVRMVSHHDNSSANPFNPDPNRDISWGEETHNEMALAFIGMTYDDQELNITPQWPLVMTPKQGGDTDD